MKGKRWPGLIITLFLVLSFVAWPPAASAHAITVDGDPSDWTMAAPTNVNTGHIGRNASAQGEYIWTDYNADVRTDGTDPDSNYELTQFRVTADASNVYFLARLSDITSTNLPYVAIAVDTDRVNGSGEVWFGDFAETQTSADAEWERLIVVNLNKTGYYDTSWTWTIAGSSYISDANDVIEISMPRTALGVSWPATLRFTVIVCQHDGSGGITDINGADSDALDCVTNYGNPGLTSNTWAEVSDGDVDYYFDVYFNPSGEPFPPLLISEVLYDHSTGGTDTNYEWVQIYNATGSSISLEGWKVGDEETVDSTEGMYSFPGTPGSIAAGAYMVIAGRANEFSYSCTPDFEFIDGTAVPDPPDMVRDTTLWSTGSWGLGNGGDEVLLLDPCWTVVDVVTWENGSYPGVTDSDSDIAAGNSIQRHYPNVDTNDCRETYPTGDFETQASNGTPCDAPTAVELSSFTASAGGLGMVVPAALGLAAVPVGVFLVRRRRA